MVHDILFYGYTTIYINNPLLLKDYIVSYFSYL